MILALLGLGAFASGRTIAATSQLTISGTPPTSVSPGSRYQFTPTVTSSTKRRLKFSVSNPPSWASFSSRGGTLSGTPQASNTGVYSNIIISVTDGVSTARLASFSITVASTSVTPTSDTAPTIAGTPSSSITVGQTYAFQPTAADADGDALTYSIASLPSWASFSTTTGRLSGTPVATNAGTYSNIVISVSDGKASTALPAFSLTVYSLVVTGSATLSWTPPTTNTDGSALTDLAGYRIVYGTSADVLTQSVQVATAGLASYTIDNLAQGTWYFVMISYDTSGSESSPSNIASMTIQ